jgi:hypothetical protein
VSNLPWVRFDTSLPDHPKILALLDMKDGRAAGFVYCCALAYAGKHGTDGFIPRGALGRVNGRPADAQKLVDVGLWLPVDGGWDIAGWAERQESTDATQARRTKAQNAARARWDQERQRKAASKLRGL